MADDIKVIIGVDSAPVQRAVQLMNNLESEVRDVEKAEKRGLITRQRAAAETKRLADQMARLKQVSAGSAKDFYSFEKSLVGSGKMARRNEVAFQQAGYQVQDFIVQVQAGTNPLIAFSQQGSQLAGFFAGPWGAMIGLGIAALSSLAMAFLATSEKAKSFEDQIGDTESALEGYFALLKSQSGIYDDVFEQNIEALKLTSETAKDLLAIAKIEAFNSIEGLAKSLADANTEAGFFRKLMLGTDIGLVGDLLNINTLLDGNITQWKNARGQVKEFIKAVRGISEADSMDAMYESAIAARDAFKENVDISAEMTSQQMEFYKQLLTTIQQLEIMGASNKAMEAGYQDTTMAIEAAAEAVKLFYDNQQDAVDKAKELKDAVVDIREAVDSQVRTLKQKLELNEFELKYGKEVEGYQKLITEQKREQFKALQISNGILGNNLAKVMEIYDANVLIEESLRRQNEISYNMMEGSAGAAALRKYGGRGTVSDKDPTFGDGTSIYKEPKKTKVGAKKESPLEKLQAQLKLEQELIGKSEEYARVRQALGDSYDKVEPKQIANLENQIRLIEDAKQAEQDRLSIMGTVESSMEDGFMSMIDGTASVGDAFKNMARMIIAELMRVLVIKRMVSGITAAFGFADGGAFSGGSQIQAYADGGVVGGPTFFPMSGGKTGLMGEAGPEAIMPLKRGANGKLGVQVEGNAGGDVNIVQNFSFAANGDDSVKKLIAQAAPQIANMTQKQIMDSRRRGGAMKSTFG